MRLLVHFHIYYLQHVDYFLGMMKNINSVRWDLFVTSPHIDEATENKIKEFKPDARIEHVPNEGYDIWPFIYMVKSICLEDYDCILKLHTKGPLPFAAHLNGMVLWWRHLSAVRRHSGPIWIFFRSILTWAWCSVTSYILRRISGKTDGPL